MSKRSQVVTASALMVLGLAAFAAKSVALPLNAVGISGSTGFDYTKILLWVGAALLVISALLYIRASAE